MFAKKNYYRRRAYKRTTKLIAKSAIKAFLNRNLEEWNWIKQVPTDVIKEELLPKGFEFHTAPRKHQLACFTLGTKLKRFLYLLDMGSGKTKIVLDLIRYRKFRSQLSTCLVVVPNLINLQSWANQIKTHAPDLSFEILQGTKTQREKLLEKVKEESPDICVINYAGLQTYMTATRKVGNRKKAKRGIVAEDAYNFAETFNMLILDEPHLYLSSAFSVSYQLCRLISWQCDFVYALTGTPFDKDPSKAWPQFHVVDKGATLGESLGMFQAAYFIEKEHYFKGVEYVFDRSKNKLLHETLQHRSIRYEDVEFSDLPKINFNKIQVMLTPAQLKRYAEILKAGQEAKEAGEMEATWIKLRQTAAGFIAVKGEDDSKIQVAFKPNGKAEALEEYLLELAPDEKVVIFHEYVYSGVIIQEVLKKLKIDYAGVGHGFKNSSTALSRFMNDHKCRAWVANCRAGGTGTDGLQKVCRYGLFYETPSSPSLRKQAYKRLHRDGQQRRVYITDLMATNVSIEKRIFASLKAGQDLFKQVCEGKEIL